MESGDIRPEDRTHRGVGTFKVFSVGSDLSGLCCEFG
jgi:hypothetical protein